jgi:hypothetical protein
MPLEQKTFFGASIRSINANAGWGTQASSLEIDLVVDPVNGDAWNPTPIGFPSYFTYYGFTFGGIVQKYSQIGNFSGNPLYKVILTDPRDILTGVQMVMNGYTGATSIVPNLYNVYGYLETQLGYGGSQINETGIPWKLVRNALVSLVNTTAINFRSQPFLLNLDELPNLPDEFRVGGGGFNMNVMEFIDAVCDAGSCDYFFKLVLTAVGHTIKVYTISRATQPLLGSIGDYLAANSEVISKENGLELRNEKTSNFIAGGQVQQIFFQTPDSGDEEEDEHDYSDDTIVQYWGLDKNEQVIIQQHNQEAPDSPYFDLDTRGIFVEGIGNTYRTDVREMRAILAGQASWEAFLWLYDTDTSPKNPHFGKATKMNLLGPVVRNVRTVIENLTAEEFNAFDGRELIPVRGKEINEAGGALVNIGFKEENIKRFYEILLAFAQEHYGRKFMVRIPFVYAKRDVDSGQITTSQEPAQDGGFIEEALFSNIINYGLMPIDTNFVTSENNLVQCYVRFDDAESLDLSKIGAEYYSLSPYRNSDGDRKYYAFIRCSLQPKVVFLDRNTAYSPRVVVVLPGPIFPRLGEGCIDFAGILRPVLLDRADELGEPDTIVDRIFSSIGSEQLFFPLCGLAEMPDLVAAPLRSNILTYGPWYVSGAPGFTECRQEESLVPWAYGTYELMNLAGEAMVSDSLSQQQLDETGSLEIPGEPALSLGDQLLSGGPYVTGVNISIGLDGVTSSYRMETWTQRFGRTHKQMIERLQRMNRGMLEQQRKFRQIRANTPRLDILMNYIANNYIATPDRVDRHSSMGYLAGELKRNSDTGRSTINVAALPSYHTGQISHNYSNKALMSLDGLLVPFSTDTTHTVLPHYDNPSASGIFNRSVVELNPFDLSSPVFNIAQGETIEDDQNLGDRFSNNMRALALRGPVIIAGWGYDTDGGVVPTHPDYKMRPDLWKVGPLDVAWNDETKTWQAGRSSAIRVGLTLDEFRPGSSGRVSIYEVASSGTLSADTQIMAFDHLLVAGQRVPPLTKCIVAKEQTSSVYFTVNYSCTVSA